MRRHPLPRRGLAITAIAATLVLGTVACGGDGQGSGSAAGPTVVVTTSILGDVATEIVGDDATVTVVVPAGADPHELQPSARQAAEMREADLLVVNGGGLEAGLQAAIDGAAGDGVTVFTALDHVDTLAAGPGDDEHGGVDPHFFTDPARMADAADALAEALAAASPELDTPRLRERADAYVAELRALDADVERTLSVVPDDRRVLVTTHDVLAYFADRYDFDLLGSVLPSLTTEGSPSAADIDALARAVDEAGVTTILADASAPTSLADTLAGEVGDVEVVELVTESLGPPGSGADTYVGMIRTDADRIAAALG